MEKWERKQYREAKEIGYKEAVANIKAGIKVLPETKLEDKGPTEKGYAEGRNKAIKNYIEKWKAGHLPEPIPKNTEFVEGAEGKIMEVVSDREKYEERKERKKEKWRKRIRKWKKETNLN